MKHYVFVNMTMFDQPRTAATHCSNLSMSCAVCKPALQAPSVCHRFDAQFRFAGMDRSMVTETSDLDANKGIAYRHLSLYDAWKVTGWWGWDLFFGWGGCFFGRESEGFKWWEVWREVGEMGMSLINHARGPVLFCR